MRKITLLALAMTCFVGFGQNYNQLKVSDMQAAPKSQSITQKSSIAERTANSANQPASLSNNKALSKAQLVAQAQALTDANRSASFAAETAKFNARTSNGTVSSVNLLENKVAQRIVFPEPYCGPLLFPNVEPITRVVIAGIDNVSPAPTGGTAHQDFTAVIGNVDPSMSYPIALEGNTDGTAFTNRFVVFVDWNQDDDFADAGETYEITNLLVGSTGTDGMQATGMIAVPADAMAGATRMRVKKIFGTTNYLMPCMGTTFGQAEDYTLMVSGTTAVFPAPYCGPLAFTSNVEPITRVLFAGIDNVSPAATGGEAHQDFTAIEGDVVAGMSYPIALEGNTDGPFTNRFAVFADWNQDDDFADAGETYTITMTIIGSTGTDGMQATGMIAVPADALAGSTRMRVKKIFGTTNYLDPCLGTGFGSAEDYTLNVTAGGGTGGGNCDLIATLEDDATSTNTWARPFADGTCCSGLGPVSYHVYGPFTVDVAGAYTFDTTTDGFDSFLFLYMTAFDPLDVTTNFVAGDDDGPGGLTTSQILDAPLAVGTDYYLVTTAFAAGDFGMFTNTITGPGTVTCGGGTGGGDNDTCADATAIACGDIAAGDTSDNTDTGGFNASNDEWFKFTGTGIAQNVTLSLCDGSTAFDSIITVYDSCGGTQVANNDDFCALQSQVTFSSDGTSTYYIAVEGFLTAAGPFSMAVTCVDIVPPSGCGVANTGTLENGKSFTNNLGRIVAHDVTVQDGEIFKLESVNLNAFIGPAGAGVTAAFVDFYVYEDNGGTPGAPLAGYPVTGLLPTSQDPVGVAFGFQLYDVELDVDDVDLPGVVGSTTVYWIGVSLEATDASNTFWENSTAGTTGFGEAYDDGLGGGFVIDPTLEGVYDIAGTCRPLGTTGGGCTAGTYTDRAAFEAAFGGTLTNEDFTGGPTAISGCDGPFSSAGNSCFPAGVLEPGFEVTSSSNEVDPTVFAPTGFSVNTSNIVGANLFASYTIINFPGNDMNAVGFDLYSLVSGSPVDARIFGTGGTLIETITLDVTSQGPVFFGYVSDQVITSVELEDLGGTNAELIGLLAFGSCDTAGVEDNVFTDFSFAPNPATDFLSLRAAGNIESATLFNLLGQKVMNVTINSNTSELNLSGLATGTYIMKVSIDGQLGTYKVIKR